jgi:hypothetical protein
MNCKYKVIFYFYDGINLDIIKISSLECVVKMELIQIIESTVFIFSLGLIVLLVLSFLLFKVKHNPDNYIRESLRDDVSITYEKPEIKIPVENSNKKKISERFIVVNETLSENASPEEIRKKQELNSRYYIYKPARKKIIKNLELSRVKD